MAKILIVDDEPDVVEFQTAFLKRRQFEVFGALNSTGAIEIIEKESPDIVFCDIRLETDTTGLAILEEAKKIKPEIIVYLVTGLLDKEIREKGLALGAKGILTKPIANPELEAIIKEALRLG